MPRLTLRSTFEHALIIMIGVAILWKGGKGLEVTWLLPLLSLLGALSLWLQTKRNSVPAVNRYYWLTAGFFCLWTVLSLYFSETRNYGLDEVLRDVSLLLLWLQLVRLAVKAREALAMRVIDAIVYASIFALLIGLFVYIFQPVERFVGSFFDPRYHTDFWPNAWAELLLIAVPLTVWKATQAVGRLRLLYLGMTAGMVASLLLSYSRGGVLALLGEVLLVLLLAWRLDAWKKRRTEPLWRRLSGPVLGVCATVFVAFFLINGLRGMFHSVQDVSTKVTFTAAEGTSSIDEREEFWQQAWQLSLERPFFGYGPYSFRFLQPHLQTEVFATSDHAHNQWLKLAMERGWPAAILWTAIVCFGLLAEVRRFRLERQWAWSTFAAIGVLGVLAHLLIDFNLQFVGVALPFWVLLGLMTAPAVQAKSSARWQNVQMGAELFVLLLLTSLAVHEATYLATASLGRRAEAKGDTAVAMQWYDQSTDSLFTRDLNLSRTIVALRAGDLEAAASAVTAYRKENAADARGVALEAMIDEARGKTLEAAEAYRQAFAWSKYNDLRVLQHWLSLTTGEPSLPSIPADEALATLQKFRDAFRKNAHFILLGDSVDAFLEICRLKHLDPSIVNFCDQNLGSVLAESSAARAGLKARQEGVLW